MPENQEYMPEEEIAAMGMGTQEEGEDE